MWTLTFIVSLIIVVISRVTLTSSEELFDNTIAKDYQVYWNVPTYLCHKYRIHFEEVSEKFGIVQNKDDTFQGDEITILHNTGMFPALLKRTDGSLQIRNGAIPQVGNLTKHLELFKLNLVKQIPNENFRGLGIIDFQDWRPIFRQNWASLTPYKDLSERLEAHRHPDEKSHTKKAENSFEKWAKTFMEETLKTAIKLRPHAKWGYYTYPLCFNISPGNPTADCSNTVTEENNKINWLFNTVNVLLPSVYLTSSLNDKEKMNLIIGRIKEAVRISNKSTTRRKIMPYVGFKYHDKKGEFLDKKTLAAGFQKIFEYGADGYIIWSRSNDFNTQEKCLEFQSYLNNTLGPIVVESIEWAKKIRKN